MEIDKELVMSASHVTNTSTSATENIAAVETLSSSSNVARVATLITENLENEQLACDSHVVQQSSNLEENKQVEKTAPSMSTSTEGALEGVQTATEIDEVLVPSASHVTSTNTSAIENIADVDKTSSSLSNVAREATLIPGNLKNEQFACNSHIVQQSSNLEENKQVEKTVPSISTSTEESIEGGQPAIEIDKVLFPSLSHVTSTSTSVIENIPIVDELPSSSSKVPREKLNTENFENEQLVCDSYGIQQSPNLEVNINVENQTSTSVEESLEGWTKSEKFKLYLGIKSKGSNQISEIHKSIPTKTFEEIKAAISHYKKLVNDNPECATKKLKAKKGKVKSFVPLASWAKTLTDNMSYEELQTETVTALRLIADLEDIPHPTVTEQIDFRKVYHHIADAMEGKSLSINRLNLEVLSSCILETSLISKSFIKPSSYKHILNSVNFKEKGVPVVTRSTPDIEPAIMRHLSGQKNYNPLGISEEHLTVGTPSL